MTRTYPITARVRIFTLLALVTMAGCWPVTWPENPILDENTIGVDAASLKSKSTLDADSMGEPGGGVGPFTEVSTGIPGVRDSSVAWGDYDNDGDLDLAILGYTGTERITRIYRNSGGGTFTDINAGLVGLSEGALAWEDYDNDGDLDLAVTGYTGSARVSRLYRNSGSPSFIFSAVSVGWTNADNSSLAWGDYNNDGRPDLALAGYQPGSSFTAIYRNRGLDQFMNISAGLPGTQVGSVKWGDYDNDGDLDLSVAGVTSNGAINRIYRNTNGVFSDISAGMAAGWPCDTAWGDFDNDGDLDLILAKCTGTGDRSKLYRNSGGVFADTGITIAGAADSSAAWGDYDNDGDLDLALLGEPYNQTVRVRVYRNDGGSTFTDIGAGLVDVMGGSLAWGDYDKDGRLDLIVTGAYYVSSTPYYVTKLYRNTGIATINTPPTAPTIMLANTQPGYVTFSWNAGSDIQTPSNGLTYNLRVGSTPGACDIFSGLANVSSGYRRVPAMGNTQKRTTWTLKAVKTGTYYWSVQAIDTAWAGSTWTMEQSVSVTAPAPTVTSIYPTSVYNISNDQQLSISGADFQPGATVKLTMEGQADIPGVLASFADNEMTFRFNLLDVTPGDWNVVVTNPDNQSCSMVKLSINSTPAPTISGILPNHGPNTGPINIDKIYGQNFHPNATVKLRKSGQPDIVAINVNIQDQYNLTCTFDLTGAAFGYWDVVVTNPDGQSGTTQHGFIVDTFTDIGLNLYSSETAAWSDYDGDGRLDLIVGSGTPATNLPVVLFYHNDGNNVFTSVDPNLAGTAAFAWGDYDNDGDLDLAMCGRQNGDGFTYCVTRICRNDGNGVFTDIGANLTGCSVGSLAWGDYDNDGRLDLILSGSVQVSNEPPGITTIYHNNGDGTFTDIQANLPAAWQSIVRWVDFDNDGDLDVALAGMTDSGLICKIYRNDGGSFVDVGAGLIGVSRATMDWADYDCDGDLDLAIAGYNPEFASVTKIYRNDGGAAFAGIQASLPYVYGGTVAWGDYDSDGKPDLGIASGTPNLSIIVVVHNDGDDTFSDNGTVISGRFATTLAWGDYDNDGRLDIAMGGSLAAVYRNNYPAANTPPTSPTNLSTSVNGSAFTFSWGAATDAQTPSAGLSYNLRVGTTPGGSDVVGGMADPTGLRRLPALGNIQKRLSWTLKGLNPAQTYYWSVQAVDPTFAGSAWATEQIARQVQFSGHVRTVRGGPVADVVVSFGDGSITATTDAAGFYQVALPRGWSGPVRCSLDYWTFRPIEQTYTGLIEDQADQDFTGYIAGDANLDGRVDFSDYLAVSQSYGRTDATWTNGDFNGDQIVNFSDYLLLRENYDP